MPDISAPAPGEPVRSLYTANRSLVGGPLNALTPGIPGSSGLKNIGLLVSISGKVTYVGTGFFCIDDRSAASAESGCTDTKVDASSIVSPPNLGELLTVTGVSTVETDAQIQL